ncbi:MAG: acylphosphatase [Spirochaetales bacterium]|nr:acylphosphatase [Spirochaetales bacterium]
MASAGLQAIHGFVSGRVQGVGFRYSAVHAAQSYRLAGWVRNTPDGRVEVFAQGQPEALSRMIAWLKEGPPMARVEHFDYTFTVPDPVLHSFTVSY